MKVKRKVVCVYGRFDNTSDFVLEPACCEEDEKDAFWIEGEIKDAKRKQNILNVDSELLEAFVEMEDIDV
ncbi:MAG: hypothetical protein WC932_06290 [archaeon]|jgi:hypothetical protein